MNHRRNPTGLQIGPVKHVSGVWRPGVDPGGVDSRVSTEPSGMGDVCLCLLLRHDLPVDDHLHGRMPQEQLWLGCRCKTRVGSNANAEKMRLTVSSCSVCVQDFAYHGLAAFFYLSAAVILAYVTLLRRINGPFKVYQIDIAAVVRSKFPDDVFSALTGQTGTSINSTVAGVD